MKNPIEVKVDNAVRAGYVRYTDAPIARTEDVLESGSVAADVDANGEVVGIEVLHVEDGTIVEAARSYARERGLGFPRDLAGTLVPA